MWLFEIIKLLVGRQRVYYTIRESKSFKDHVKCGSMLMMVAGRWCVNQNNIEG
jgi:hypothetical protein